MVNPIAGMGGRVGLKGTDGAADEAVRRGAAPVAPAKADEMLRALAAKAQAKSISWSTASGAMGEDALRAAGLAAEVLHRAGVHTTAEDTVDTCRKFLAHGVDLVVFVGGDGTARDVATA